MQVGEGRVRGVHLPQVRLQLLGVVVPEIQRRRQGQQAEDSRHLLGRSRGTRDPHPSLREALRGQPPARSPRRAAGAFPSQPRSYPGGRPHGAAALHDWSPGSGRGPPSPAARPRPAPD